MKAVALISLLYNDGSGERSASGRTIASGEELRPSSQPPAPGSHPQGHNERDPTAEAAAVKTREEKTGTVLEGTIREMGTRSTPPSNAGRPAHQLTREDVASVPSEQDKDEIEHGNKGGEVEGAGGQADFNMVDSSAHAGEPRPGKVSAQRGPTHVGAC